MIIPRLLELMDRIDASDLHVQPGAPPTIRQGGRLRPVQCEPPAESDVKAFLARVLTPHARRDLDRLGSCDLAFTFGQVRLRVNAFRQADTVALAVRRLHLTVPTVEQLNLPGVVAEIADLPRGLVLISGTTSSGKSTTIAAMLGRINRTRRRRIITIEDPVEYIHASDQSLIAQVEIGRDSPDYAQAVRQVLRQDPDVILIGELREALGIRTALRAADTGHLVFATVHATNARQTVERLIAMFPPDEHKLLLTQLSLNIQAVLCQRLLPARNGQAVSLLPAVEILRGSATVRKCILEQRYDAIQQAIINRDMGMQSFDQHLAELYRAQRVAGHVALRASTSPEALTRQLRGISTRDDSGGLVR